MDRRRVESMTDAIETPVGLMRVDDNVTYYPFVGPARQVRDTHVHEDIKNGKPGFDGIAASGETVWGYADQVTRVVKRERIR